MVKSRNILPPKRFWLEWEVEFLRRNYADALTTRYCAALADDWHKRVHIDADQFRREIGLVPVTPFSKINSPENLARLNRIALGKPQYKDGPLPETGWD